ncbi:MAG: hypothetical protein HY048_09700 [Acidobacteria bacterium]|nr:hypothetical protein [Acidobacteriota bacterium]
MKTAIAVLAVGLLAASASSQPPLTGRLPGRSIGEEFHRVAGTQVTQHTVTLRFGADDDRPDFTVEMVTRIADHQPAAPGVVDIIVTQLRSEDESPAMLVQVDGESQSVPARLHGRRSIATSMPFDAFAKMIAANTIIYRAFGEELEFSSGQMRVLRAKVGLWTGRSRP